MGQLQNKVALVLGAANKNNMCQAIAREYAKEGAKVVVAGRREAPLKELAEEIGGAWTLCDITKKPEIEAMAAFAKRRYGKFDIAVNGAAKGVLKPFEEHTAEDVELMLDISFKGAFEWLQVMVREISSPGSIINISSAVATIQFENHMAYMGAKAGMDHVMRAVANEYGHKGIRINTLAPGLTDTPMLQGMAEIPGLLAAFEKEYPLGRITTIDDIAFAALFLANDRCFMTGQTLHVTGGLTLRRNPTQAEINASIQAAAGK
jgi:2-hydroxycyclohexanecarboxyl-CoA dehydrogenase